MTKDRILAGQCKERISEIKSIVIEDIENFDYFEGYTELLFNTLNNMISFMAEHVSSIRGINQFCNKVMDNDEYPEICELEYSGLIAQRINEANLKLSDGYQNIELTYENIYYGYYYEREMALKDAEEKASGGYHKDTRRYESRSLYKDT